jgi:hypothetical protein
MADDRVRALVAAIADGVTATAEQFLESVGRGAGHFLQGSDVFYPSVLGSGNAARELLAENGVRFGWTAEDRVILMHQGYQFDFLRGVGPDPEVWSYCEGSTVGVPVLSHPCFTDWLQAQVKEQTRAWARLVPWYEAEKAKPPGERRVFFGRMNPDGSVTEEQ